MGVRNIAIGVATILTLFVGSASLVAVFPSQANALTPDPACNARFLTLPAWYNGLAGKDGGNCTVISPTDMGGEKDTQVSRFIWRIALNGIDILLQVVAYAAVGFIIYGGFVYLTSAGRSDKINRGREMILNAVIGLVISLFAIAVVAFIGGQIGTG
jgi:hypothetical protein